MAGKYRTIVADPLAEVLCKHLIWTTSGNDLICKRCGKRVEIIPTAGATR